MIAFTVNFFLSHTFLVHGNAPPCLFELRVYNLVALSDQIQDLSLIFVGLEILRQSETVSELSGMLLPLSEMPCLEALGKVIPCSPSKYL